MANALVTRTVLFADICGSTRLYEELGDERARDHVARVLSRMADVAVRHGGTVVKYVGDEILAVFPSSGAAAAAARAMHEAVDERARPASGEEPAANLHIGLQEGPVVLAADDVFGDAVNVAARLVSLAKPRQTLTTGDTVHGLTALEAGEVRPVEKTILRGKSGEVVVCELVWERSRVTVVVDPDRIHTLLQMAVEHGRLVLGTKEREVSLSEAHPVATFGRLPENDIMVNRPRVSRYHARVELRRAGYYLEDQSSNGTVLMPDGGPATFLLREEKALEGSGWIGLGEQPDPDSGWAIRYRREDR